MFIPNRKGHPMPGMTDPTDALTSFQQALLAGEIDLQRGSADRDLYVHADRPNGELRLSYVRLEGSTVIAFANFVWCDPIEGEPCFQIGYAVPLAFRGRGLARDAVTAAIAEMQIGLTRNGIATFHIEAIVGADNAASQRVAQQTISPTATTITDEVSGEPALQYVRKVTPKGT